MKSCIKATQVPNKLGYMIQDIIIYDSSVHNVLCQVMCISRQALEVSNAVFCRSQPCIVIKFWILSFFLFSILKKQQLYISHHYDLKEIEDVQLAVCSAFDIVHSILADLLEVILVPANRIVKYSLLVYQTDLC